MNGPLHRARGGRGLAGVAALTVLALGALSTGCAENPSYTVRWQIADGGPLDSPKECTEAGIARVVVETKDANGLRVDLFEEACFPPEFFDPDAVRDGPELIEGNYEITFTPLTRSLHSTGQIYTRSITVNPDEPVALGDVVFEPAPECSDGIDNDRDGAVDDADAGCRVGDSESGDVGITTYKILPTLFGGLVSDCADIKFDGGRSLEFLQLSVDGETSEELVVPCTTAETATIKHPVDDPTTVTLVGLDDDLQAVTAPLTTEFDPSSQITVNANFTGQDFIEPITGNLSFSVNFLSHPDAAETRRCDPGITPGQLELAEVEVTIVDGDDNPVMVMMMPVQGNNGNCPNSSCDLDGTAYECPVLANATTTITDLTWTADQTYNVRAAARSAEGDVCFETAADAFTDPDPSLEPNQIGIGAPSVNLSLVLGRPDVIAPSCADCQDGADCYACDACESMWAFCDECMGSDCPACCVTGDCCPACCVELEDGTADNTCCNEDNGGGYCLND